jgi:hypothetical protein
METPGKMLLAARKLLGLYVLGRLTSRRSEGLLRPLDGVHL